MRGEGTVTNGAGPAQLGSNVVSSGVQGFSYVGGSGDDAAGGGGSGGREKYIAVDPFRPETESR